MLQRYSGPCLSPTLRLVSQIKKPQTNALPVPFDEKTWQLPIQMDFYFSHSDPLFFQRHCYEDSLLGSQGKVTKRRVTLISKRGSIMYSAVFDIPRFAQASTFARLGCLEENKSNLMINRTWWVRRTDPQRHVQWPLDQLTFWDQRVPWLHLVGSLQEAVPIAPSSSCLQRVHWRWQLLLRLEQSPIVSDSCTAIGLLTKR